MAGWLPPPPPKELREHGYDGDLHVVAGESHNPYERPPLSKGYLLGKDNRDDIFPEPGEWYTEQQGDAEHGQAGHGDRRPRGDARVRSRAAVRPAAAGDRRDPELAGRARAAPVRSSTGVCTASARSTTARRSRPSSRGGKRRVVLVGSGWIGLELAAAAREYGNEVVVVTHSEVPLAGALGDELGRMFQELHEQHGVRFELGREIRGFAVKDGAVTGVETDSGTTDGDLVILGIGATPDTALAEAAGIETDNGILTDEHLATSRDDIYAAGDVANPYHPVLKARLRNEHWANAIAGGKVAAASMTGRKRGARRHPLLLHRSVRPGDGVLGLRPARQGCEGRLPRRPCVRASSSPSGCATIAWSRA